MAKPFEVGNTCYLRVMDRRYLSEIRGVAKDTVWVSFPGANYPIEGMGVELEFHAFDGFVRYHTRVAIGPKKKGDGIVLQRTEAATRLKHRRSWRVPVSLPARIQSGDDVSVQRGRILDLSSEGALLQAMAGIGVGSPIAVDFALPGKPRLLVRAMVIHSGEAKKAGQRCYGLRFTEIPPEARDSLTWFLWGKIKRIYSAEIRELYPRRARRKKRRKAGG